MAQNNFFDKLNDTMKNLEQARQNGIISATQEKEHINEMLSMYDAINAKKATGREWDLKTQTIWGNLKRFGKEMADDAENLRKAKKTLKKTEDEINNLGKVYNELMARGNKEAADMIKKKKKQLELEKEIQSVNYDTAKSSVSRMGSAFNMIRTTGLSISNIFGGVFSFFGGILSAAFGIAKKLFDIVIPIEKAWKLFLQMQTAVGNLSADIGMTFNEHRLLLDSMPSLYNEIIGYGGKIEDIAKVIRSFSEETGKNRIFSQDEIAGIVKLGYSTGLTVDGVTKMVAEFDNLGISLSKTLKVADRGRNVAAKFNLNQTKVLRTTSEVVKNLTGTAFGRSVEDLTKLAAKAETLRFNLAESVKSFKDSFFSPEKAVEAAAKIQVLGGEFAQMFGDPMSLMYDSMNDADGMAEKLINATKNLAIKTKDGIFEIPPAQRQIIRETLDALGQGGMADDVFNASIEQAKLQDKMVQLTKSGLSLTGISEDDRMALANLMTLNKDGQYEIKMPNGVQKLVSNITSQDQLTGILAQRKANEQAAQQRLNLSERFNIMLDRFAIGLTPLFTELNKLLEDSGLLAEIERLGKDIASTLIPLMKDLFSPGGQLRTGIDMFLSGFKEFISGVRGIVNDPKMTFWQKIGAIFDKVLSFVMEGVMPYIKIAFGEIFKALKDVPFIGDSLYKAGLRLESKDERTREIAEKIGIDNKPHFEKMVKSARQQPTGGGRAGGLFDGLMGGISGVIDGAAGLVSSTFGAESAAQYFYQRAGAQFSISGAGFKDMWNGGDQARQDLITGSLNGNGYSDEALRGMLDLDMIPKDLRGEMSKVKAHDALAMSNGKLLTGSPGSAMALISELNANKLTQPQGSSEHTVIVNVSGNVEHIDNGIAKQITAKELYDTDPQMFGKFIETTMAKHEYGSANYVVNFGVSPL